MLKPGDQGELNGLFEVHFGIRKLPDGVNITREVWENWNDEVMVSIMSGNLSENSLPELFSLYFKVIPTRKITFEVCDEWGDLFYHFLTQHEHGK